MRNTRHAKKKKKKQNWIDRMNATLATSHTLYTQAHANNRVIDDDDDESQLARPNMDIVTYDRGEFTANTTTHDIR